MAEPGWVYLERCGGKVQRVTVLDEDLRVIATHERDGAASRFAAEETQLLRAVELVERVDLEMAG